MARRLIIDQSFQKFNELAMATYNLRLFEKKYKAYPNIQDELEVIKYEQAVDRWFEENTKEIPSENKK